MGYITNFTLIIERADSRDNSTIMDVMRAINEVAGFTVFYERDIQRVKEDIDNGGINGCTTCFEAKWYTCRKELEQVAVKYPDFLITVEGEGEDKEDWWVAKFKNEEVAFAKAVVKSPWDILEEKGY